MVFNIKSKCYEKCWRTKGMYNKKFDPLSAKYEGHEAVVMLSIQREINNILNSYVGMV